MSKESLLGNHDDPLLEIGQKQATSKPPAHPTSAKQQQLASQSAISYASGSDDDHAYHFVEASVVASATRATTRNKIDTDGIVIAEVCGNIKAAADRFSHGMRKMKPNERDTSSTPTT
eukprot:m.291786 g.291786  ORF g.291786 m.291786 type:complete len:118 (-) comp19985_c0_seq5:1639-1992(-)